MAFQKPLVVVVDDEQDLIDFYDQVFAEKFDVKGFTNPEDFLAAIEKKSLPNLALVVADYGMPKMSGLKMIEMALAKGTTFASLLLSGNVSKEIAVNALNIGVNKVIEKPATADQLFSTAVELVKVFRIEKIDEKAMSLSDQLSELYILYRDLLLPEITEDAGSDLKNQSPVEMVSTLERQLVQLQMEKKLIKQGTI